MSYELRTDYWADPKAKTAFREFARAIFGIDFAAWESAGFWDTDYHPFSFFDGGAVVANVCVYSMRMVVDGRPARAAQISCVATRPDLRRQGLNRRLTAIAMEWARETGHEFTFLFASEEALPFYRALGFVPTEEHSPVVRLDGRAAPRRPGARSLDFTRRADIELVHRLAHARCPVSQQLGVLNVRLLMFHALGPLRECAWFIEPLELVVFARRRDGVLTLSDVVGAHLPPFAEILPFVADEHDREVVFRFLPDALGLLKAGGALEFRRLEGSNLHLSPGAHLRAPLLFPATAQA